MSESKQISATRVNMITEILNRARDQEAALLFRLDELRPIASDSNRGDEMDVARGFADADTIARLSAHRRMSIAAIDAAFERLKSGGYGICAECGIEISISRLKALPFAINCVDCQHEREAQRHEFGSSHRATLQS
jgi:RNA polymerase-binding transcription factor